MRGFSLTFSIMMNKKKQRQRTVFRFHKHMRLDVVVLNELCLVCCDNLISLLTPNVSSAIEISWMF